MTERTQKILTLILLGLLVLWGGYTFLYYAGMPVHRASLIADDASTWVDSQCSSIVCRGFFTLWPMVQMFWMRALPLMPYLITSLVLMAAFFGWKVMQQGSTKLTLRMKPWHFYGLFFASLWLIAFGFTFTSSDGLAFNQIVQPTATVYRDVPENAL